MWHWPADSLYLQLSIDHNSNVHCQVLCLKTKIVSQASQAHVTSVLFN